MPRLTLLRDIFALLAVLITELFAFSSRPADRGNDNWLIKYDGAEIVDSALLDPTEVSAFNGLFRNDFFNSLNFLIFCCNFLNVVRILNCTFRLCDSYCGNNFTVCSMLRITVVLLCIALKFIRSTV